MAVDRLKVMTPSTQTRMPYSRKEPGAQPRSTGGDRVLRLKSQRQVEVAVTDLTGLELKGRVWLVSGLLSPRFTSTDFL